LHFGPRRRETRRCWNPRHLAQRPWVRGRDPRHVVVGGHYWRRPGADPEESRRLRNASEKRRHCQKCTLNNAMCSSEVFQKNRARVCRGESAPEVVPPLPCADGAEGLDSIIAHSQNKFTASIPLASVSAAHRLTRQAKISPNTCASISCVAVTQLESRLLCATRGGARAHAGRHQAGRGLSPVLSLPRAALCPTQCAKVNAVSRKRSFEVLW
jgi:hypothetical protein